MELWATGFNAHAQLQPHTLDSNEVPPINRYLSTSTRILPQAASNQPESSNSLSTKTSPIKVLSASFLSCLILQENDDIIYTGYGPAGNGRWVIQGVEAGELKACFGPTEQLQGCVTTDREVSLLEDTRMGNGQGEMRFTKTAFEIGRVEHLAVKEDGEVCICISTGMSFRLAKLSHLDSENVILIKAAPGAPTTTNGTLAAPPSERTTILAYPNLDDFIQKRPPSQTFALDHRVIQLAASATAFIVLTSTGTVLTMGSRLHSSILGRPCNASASPAETPLPIPFLGGIPIAKIAAGGWIGAALSRDRDLYIWGGRTDGSDKIAALEDEGDGELVRLVDIEGKDVIDFGIGAGHVVVLVEGGEVWVSGDGSRGQLGLGLDEEITKGGSFWKDWVKVGFVPGEGKRIFGVGCGFWCSWLLCGPEDDAGRDP